MDVTMQRSAFTIDVEDYFQVDALSSVISTSQWDGFPSRVVANTSRLLDMLDEHDVKATFFVLGWVAQRQPALVRTIVSRGHEIASHGWSHRRILSQQPAEFRAETRDAKRLLEDLTQKEVLGYRAATYSITRRTLWALDILLEEGFRYDSSIFPVRHDRYGIPDANPTPHRLKTPLGNHIAEFPLTAVRIAGVNVPIAGGGYFRFFPYVVTRWGLNRVRNVGRPVVFYVHPWEIDHQQPRITHLGWRSQFRHYLNLDRTTSRLNRLLGDFRFGTMRDCLASQGLL